MLIYTKIPNSNKNNHKLKKQITQIKQPTNIKTINKNKQQTLNKKYFNPQLKNPHSSKLFYTLL